MYALVIVSCAISSMVADSELAGYEDCILAMPKAATYASVVECQAAVNAASEIEVPDDRRAFVFCLGAD